MSISGIGSNTFTYQPRANASPSNTSSEAGKTTSTQSSDPELQKLIDYFNMPPAERILKNWLEAHGISEEEYKAMSPEKKDAIQKQIAEEIKEKNEQKAKSHLDLLV